MLAKVSLIDWPFPSDNSEVPDFADYEERDRYVSGFVNQSLVFEDVAFDGRVNTNIRLELATTWLEEVCGCWTLGSMNYCKVEFFDRSENVQGCRFYFIDGIDILNSYYAGDAVGTLGNSVVSLNIRADPWMNSMLPLRDVTGQAGICRPCIVEQAHVDRWDSGALPKIYPIKEGCDGWRVKESSNRIKTFNEADQSSSHFEIFLIAWLNDGGEDTRQHLAIFIPEKNVKGGDNVPHAMPTIEDVLRGDMCYNMGLKSENILFIGPAPYLPVKVTGTNTAGYELEVLEYRTSLGGNQWFGGTGTTIGGTGSTVWGVDITFTCYPFAWRQDAATYLKRPTKPSWALGGISYSDTAEPALYMDPYRQDVVCDAQGMPQFNLPDVERLTTDTPVLFFEPAIDPGGYSTALELGYRSGGSEHKNAGILGTRSVVDTPNANLVSNKWLDYSMGQRTLDMAYKKQSAFIEGSVGMASSAASGIVMGNVAGAAAGIASGLIGAWGTQEKYRLDTKYNDATIRNQPNQMAVQGDGSALIKNGAYNLYVYNMKLDETSMKEAADRFMLYGYNLNMLMVPDWTNRRYFNYIQTRNINLSALVPRQRDIRDQLETVFNRGVRVWHMDRVEADGMHYSDFDFTKENIEQALIS